MRAHTVLASLIVGTTVLMVGGPARAFCGFYVAPEGESKAIVNDASMVALMRDGERTVLSMSNNYRGPASGFAMVVPVPVVLRKEQVKTLDRSIFDKLEALTAPRLVEYWEQDPCADDSLGSLASIGGMGYGAGYGRMGAGHGGGGAVVVEAQFAVGEYEVVILSATESDALETWLHEHKYTIPKGASAALAPYVKSGQKFFVAKVDPKKVKVDETGALVLSPLRFHYDTSEFKLPVRLGLMNSAGKQDLLIFLLGHGQRYEVANYPNVTIPTNLDVSDDTRSNFGAFYTTLFDATLARKGQKSVVTEYSWQSTQCDPCPVPPLSAADAATLGLDISGPRGLTLGPGNSWLAIDATPLPQEVVSRIIRASSARIRSCLARVGTLDSSFTADTVTYSSKLVLDANGTVKDVSTSGSFEPVRTCLQGAMYNLTFPEPEHRSPLIVRVIASVGPSSSGLGSDLVLTRLHARYDASTMSEDLVFKNASPIAGGNEEYDAKGALVRGVHKSDANSFQARFAIRHSWTGPIKCKNPHRGVWGGNPLGGSVSEPAAATKLGNYGRGTIKLSSYVRKGIDDPGLLSMTVPVLAAPKLVPPIIPVVEPLLATPAPSVSAAPSASVPVAASASAATSPSSVAPAPPPSVTPAPRAGGCGCEMPGRRPSTPFAWPAVGLLLASRFGKRVFSRRAKSRFAR